MKRSNIYIILLLILVTSCSRHNKNSNITNSDQPYVVMLSMDGFRWDYPEKVNTPNLDNIEKTGVRAASCIPCFPTKTFPNHYSMATGLYPDHHGIIFNRFYARDLGKYYSISNHASVTNTNFYFGEPIWVTAEKQGLKSASFYWVGSEAPHDSIFPTYHFAYNESVPFDDRIDQVIEWLKLPEDKRPHLILWYLHEPDAIAHEVGPNHLKTEQMISYLDSLIGVFNKKISELPISDEINVIVTSDHGMSELKKEKTVYLDRIIDKDWIIHLDGSNPVYSMEVKKAFYDTTYMLLAQQEHIKVWKKNEIPARLNLGKNPRIKDFIVVADSSWSLLPSSKKRSYSGGAHGYDNKNKDMHSIFYAYGPAFKKGYKHTSINNIDIYPLICKILKLESSPVDGSIQNVSPLLNNDK